MKCKIVETEAYCGAEDKACHAFNNKKSEKTKAFWLDGGHLYIYCIHSNFALNIVCGDNTSPEGNFKF